MTDAVSPESEATAQRVSRREQLHRNLRQMRMVMVSLLVLALLAALYVGRPVLLPMAMALLLSFLLRPVVRRLARWHVPLPLSSVLLVLLIASALAVSILSLREPASQWLLEAPRALQQLQYRIDGLTQSMEDVKAAAAEMEKLGQIGDESSAPTVTLEQSGFNERLLLHTGELVVGIFTTLILLFFILGWGERLYRNVISSLPHFHEQRQVVEIAQEIEEAIARYLATITVINLLLGAVVAAVMYLIGMPNPVLWGVVTALLNYMPYLGPAVTAVILGMVALLTYPSIGQALLVPVLFLSITSLEGYVITPMAVGTRLTLNPLLIFVSLMFWFWLWGIVGALLTVPILVCVKVTLERVGTAKSVARIMD
ncbi:MAG: AI-2E family transporter [Thiogranum sp.]|nr:AI-2E family transporter [Thiogranum sp.]